MYWNTICQNINLNQLVHILLEGSLCHCCIVRGWKEISIFILLEDAKGLPRAKICWGHPMLKQIQVIPLPGAVTLDFSAPEKPARLEAFWGSRELQRCQRRPGLVLGKAPQAQPARSNNQQGCGYNWCPSLTRSSTLPLISTRPSGEPSWSCNRAF